MLNSRPRFVKLTDADGEPLVVNPHHVTMVRQARYWNITTGAYEPRGARIYVVGDNGSYAVRETAAQVLDKLTGMSGWTLEAPMIADLLP